MSVVAEGMALDVKLVYAEPVFQLAVKLLIGFQDGEIESPLEIL